MKNVAKFFGYIGYAAVVILLIGALLLIAVVIPSYLLYGWLFPIIGYWAIPVIACMYALLVLIIYGMVLINVDQDKKEGKK